MNNKFWSFILIVIWLFILVLFTKDQVFDLQYVSAERETLISKREQKTKEHSNLSNISKEIKKWEIKELDKYSTPLKEDELLEFVYKVVDKINSTWANKVTINNLSLTNAKLNNMQFLESNVNLSLTVPNESLWKLNNTNFLSQIFLIILKMQKIKIINHLICLL